MKQTLSILAALIAVILAGCGAPPSTEIADLDWCYLFDFTKNPQGFAIASGTWTAQGIASDSTGLLQTSYSYDRDVYPSVVHIKAVRPTGVTGTINTTAAGTAFGVSTYFTAPFPEDLDVAELRFTPDGGGVEYIGDRNAINVTVDASAPIAIESLFVGGHGVSPFITNLCDPATPTPPWEWGTGTSVPEVTPTLTLTATSTGTAGPTATPGGPWTCFYDFGVSDYGWIPGPINGASTNVTRDSSGWQDGLIGSALQFRGVQIQKTFDPALINITKMTFDHHRVDGLGDSGSDAHAVHDGFSSYYSAPYWQAPPEPLELTGPFNPVIGYLTILIFSGADGVSDPGGSVTIRSLTLEGTGTKPSDCVDPTTPTPSPSPTAATPTPAFTATPEPLWSACLAFDGSNYSFEGVNAIYEEDLGWVQDAGEWGIKRAGLGPSSKKQIKFQFNGPFAGSIRLTDLVGINETGWHLATGDEFVVDFSGESWIPTQNMAIEFDGNYLPLTLEKICWVDLAPSGTPVPSGSRTPLPTPTGTLVASRTPVNVPPPVVFITATSGAYITTTPMWGGTPIVIGTTTPGGTPGGGTPSGEGSGEGHAGDVGDMIGFGLQIGTGLFGALGAYLGQANSMIQDLLSAFINATPQPIPGMPLCMTNPMQHDICAIYYILDFTIFAQGTPGALIIPLLLIVFNIYIAIYFVRWVLRLIGRGEGVTSVE